MGIQILPLNHTETIGDNCEICVSAARVHSFQSIREEEVLNLIKTIQANDGLPVNLSDKVFSMTYAITAGQPLVKNAKTKKHSYQLFQNIQRRVQDSLLLIFFPSLIVLDLVSVQTHKAEKIHREGNRILGNIVNDHKESRARARDRSEEVEEDLVDVLLRLQGKGEFPLTDSNIKAVILVSQFYSLH